MLTLTDTAPTPAALIPFSFEGETRVRDIDLGKRLGFARPAKIRELIERHKENLCKISVLPTAGKTSSEQGGRPTDEYLLNRKQAIFITAKSDTEVATDITIEIIERFDAYERGAIPTLGAGVHGPSVAFQGYFTVARLIGFDPNQAALSAGKAAKVTTGENPLEVMGITHMVALQQETMLTPTDLGAKLGGITAKAVNKMLEERGLQTSFRDLKNKITWEATEAGKPHSVMLDTAKKHSDGTPIKQIKWLASVVDVLRAEPAVETEMPA